MKPKENGFKLKTVYNCKYTIYFKQSDNYRKTLHDNNCFFKKKTELFQYQAILA